MTSEEIIEKLLGEEKITVKEAMIILKDLATASVKFLFTGIDKIDNNKFTYYTSDIFTKHDISTIDNTYDKSRIKNITSECK